MKLISTFTKCSSFKKQVPQLLFQGNTIRLINTTDFLRAKTLGKQQLNVTKISQNLKRSSFFIQRHKTSEEQAEDKYNGSESNKANYMLGTICSNFQHNPILNLKECNEIESRHNFCTGL